MKVDSRFPLAGQVAVADLLARLAGQPPGGRLRVFDPRIIDFLGVLSRRLLAPALVRRHPEVGSLGYFLRRSELRRARSDLDEADALRFPRGLVFHVPPANVDTIFVYSWALSALAGNANVVRLSARATGAAELILAELTAAAQESDPVVSQTQAVVSYGHDPELTAAFSQACDLRVIWGGDSSVDQIRRAPLASHARDLTFPDRASFAAVSVPGWLAADRATRVRAAEGFALDAYWFDQAACASPRAVFLVGGAAAAARGVREEFLGLLTTAVRARGFAVDPAMAVQKRVSTYGLAADGLATEIRFAGNEVVSLWLADHASVPRHWLGAGSFPFAHAPSLLELVPVFRRRDQTLSCFGFGREELVEFVTALGGRGIDRLVPFGAALSFSAIWDGHHLLREFTRLTTISTGDPRPRAGPAAPAEPARPGRT
jgi:hypothetical protein